MVLHSALVEQDVAREQISFENRPAVCGEGRTENRKLCIERRHQGVCNRPDITVVRRVESRAILEKELRTALIAQPVEGGDRLRDGFGRRNGPRFECDDAGIGLHRRYIAFRHANQLDGAHA